MHNIDKLEDTHKKVRLVVTMILIRDNITNIMLNEKVSLPFFCLSGTN